LPQNEYKNYFTNTYKLNKRFKKLNKKKLFSLDEIPNIVLKYNIVLKKYLKI